MNQKTVALFPGQGSQHVGMAKELHSEFKLVREIFEEASDAIRADLKKLCFDGPESDLTLTENTQPCLLVASVAAFRVAQAELGYTPAATAGHSLGEYSALVAAGSLQLATAARWVRERGGAMQRAVPAGQGTMAAVLGLEDGQVEELCRKATAAALAKRASRDDIEVETIVQPANYNAPGQLVIAGSVDAVGEAVAILKSGAPEFKGGKAIPLTVSAPFHCKLMGGARHRMAEIFSTATASEKPRAPAWAYYSNRTARPTQEAGVVLELLVEQVDHPVLWKQTGQAMIESGFALGIEFGPGKVLQGLAKRIAQQAGRPFAVMSFGDKASLQAVEAELKKN